MNTLTSRAIPRLQAFLVSQIADENVAQIEADISDLTG